MNSPESDIFDPFDDAPWRAPREMLACRGVNPPSPGDLSDDRELRGRLWELIYALAALRFFFYSTDHLSDHDEWLEELTSDIPPEAGFNCHVDVIDSGTDEGTDIWLRHYASRRDRKDWAIQFPDCPIPPHEWPPHDRDRFLPVAYPAGADPWVDEDDDDPLGLAAVDREIRGENPQPPAIVEHWERPLDTFSRAGFSPLPPEEITDASMSAYLWELLHELACRGFIVQRTGHLKDRELYSLLWRRGLREHAILPGKSPVGAWFYDCCEGGENTQAWLRYHAGEQARSEHARDYPEEPLPPRETPPYPRDWRLPKGPF
jgi:hypothetical protein